MSATRILVTLATVGCGVAIITSLLIVGNLFYEINNMYDDVMEEAGEFKTIANDAWRKMMRAKDPNFDRSKRPNAHSMFRAKRQYNAEVSIPTQTQAPPAQCNCGRQPNNCPAGPPGPPGEAGHNGEDGTNGPNGQPGPAGETFAISAKQDGCIKCPAGPPGPSGPIGPSGGPGQDGQRGQDGHPGQDGRPGQQGPAGDEGQPGEDGQPGSDGTRGHGAPGQKGPNGAPGQPGANGEAGQRGHDGQAGAPGLQGPAGQPGGIGRDGGPGEAGRDGPPGKDAQYCPCPPRTAEVYHPAPAPPGYGRRARS